MHPQSDVYLCKQQNSKCLKAIKSPSKINCCYTISLFCHNAHDPIDDITQRITLPLRIIVLKKFVMGHLHIRITLQGSALKLRGIECKTEISKTKNE